MRYIITIALFFGMRVVIAQDGQFSQFFSTSIHLNPAFASFESAPTLKVNHKSAQETKDGSVKQLSLASFIHPLQKTTSRVQQNGGIGLTVVQEKAGFKGVYQSTAALATASYVIPFDVKGLMKLSFGLQGGIVMNKLNTDGLQFGSQYNPYIGYDNTQQGEKLNENGNTYAIFNSGFIFSFTDHENPLLQQNAFLIGISADYLNKPKTRLIANGVGRKASVIKTIATAKIRISRNLFIHPSSLILRKRGQFQFNNGMYFSTYVDPKATTIVQIGGWYRVNDSFILLGGIRYKNMQVGGSIDFNSSSINSNEVIVSDQGNSTFEISFSYSFNKLNSIIKVNNPLF
ncbi:type IX secretion system membrane protein, PorP/SprF family [Ekhidna lutea]|uniref:Type IX secretion system membrane protein, PorP/SprF family n=1 Tax=Ekhidna lutea TaxID=447679 RepID=A0A239JPJ6_EKHLU|nr:PorP/SprF family type IX secretion system membrane protein [Ekhidna lutea]SNT07472.1 type IX secretion system membrane protein, PorP/SprF family [Ekhidna lutea]